MSDFSNYLGAALLDHVTGNASYTAPSNLYVALSETAPNEDGSNLTEPDDGTWYSRVSTSSADWDTATTTDPPTTENTNKIDFGTADADSAADVTHFAIMDAATGGNMLYHSALDSEKTINNGDPVSFPAGNLVLKHD